VPLWRLPKGDQHCPVISFSRGISRSKLQWCRWSWVELSFSSASTPLS
jgi:hypothetical protein